MTRSGGGPAPLLDATTLDQPVLPCRTHDDPDLWFADSPADLERAKQLCIGCPVRTECLATALARQEPWGVWGGEILERGAVIARKRPRGRPSKAALERERLERERVERERQERENAARAGGRGRTEQDADRGAAA